MKVNWKNQESTPTVLYFEHLSINETFKIQGHEAVYTKVKVKTKSVYDISDKYKYYMYEIMTGNLYPPTNSPVELVNVEVNIDLEKPQLYDFVM